MTTHAVRQLCGAHRRRGGICRGQPAGPNGRCRNHGGLSTGPRRPPLTVRLQAGARLAQARMRALGLPWYGGRLPGYGKVLRRMAESVVKADHLLLELDAAPLPAVEGAGELGPVLHEGTRAGLVLARDTVRMVQAELEREGAQADIKLLRLGNDAGMQLARLSMKLADNELQRRKGDAVERLLEAIAAEKATTTK